MDATTAALAAAIEELSARLAVLEAAGGQADPPSDGRTVEIEPDRDEIRGKDHWLVGRLARNTGPQFTRGDVSGSIAFGGRVRTLPNAPTYSWQCEYTLPDVLASDMASAAAVFAALGHPLRLRMLLQLLLGASTVAELQQIKGIGTTGQVHHHIRELRASGLVVSRGRNHYAIPGDRVVHVLVMVAAALGRRVIGRAGSDPE